MTVIENRNNIVSINIKSVFRNGTRLCVRRILTVMVKLTGRNLVIQTVCGLWALLQANYTDSVILVSISLSLTYYFLSWISMHTIYNKIDN